MMRKYVGWSHYELAHGTKIDHSYMGGIADTAANQALLAAVIEPGVGFVMFPT
jgi:hypothetical protein